MNTHLIVSIIILSGSLVLSCQKKEPDVLSQNEMVRILTEIYLTEDKVNRLSLDIDSSEKVFNVMLNKISDKTGVSDTLFKKSLEYYSAHPKDMEKIYTALVDSLNLKEQRSSSGK